ncbi:DUF2288 domain-containing protein [Pseudomonas sp. Irchel 3E20]|uniref:DUF2288 domain-containing protein n=1 Tax=Pseudomonas sp. Irchel 3E20 TaxID=2008983 RepID=UPI002114040C|nr:DUF2288 domain-containing protein [Pseudomonas sp. Irchel 3E20]
MKSWLLGAKPEDVALLKEKDIITPVCRGTFELCRGFANFSIVDAFISGFFCPTTDVMIAPISLLDRPMIEEPSTLYAKLLGETAPITWKELEPFFAKGALLWVDGSLDLIEAAQAMAQNEADKVAAWLATETLGKVSASRALDLVTRDPQLWAVVVSPWIMVQERAEA